MKMKTEEQSKQENGIVWIGIDRLHPHKDNPRKDLGDLRELADSIRAKGVLQNLTVVRDGDDYTIIIGHRRTAAAKMAGLTKLPCIIAEMTPAEQVQTMLLENMQRSDLTVYEQAKGFQMMLDFGDSVDYIAEKTGFSKTTIRRRLKMAELDGEVLRRAALRKVDLMDYDKLAGIEDINTRNAVLAEIGTNNFNNALKKALDAQTAKRKKEKWEKIFSERGMTEIPIADSWNAKYRRLVTLDGEPGDEKIGDYLKKYSSLYF